MVLRLAPACILHFIYIFTWIAVIVNTTVDSRVLIEIMDLCFDLVVSVIISLLFVEFRSGASREWRMFVVEKYYCNGQVCIWYMHVYALCIWRYIFNFLRQSYVLTGDFLLQTCIRKYVPTVKDKSNRNYISCPEEIRFQNRKSLCQFIIKFMPWRYHHQAVASLGIFDFCGRPSLEFEIIRRCNYNHITVRK